MFNLEESVSEWRSQMFAARIPRQTVDELDSHLRDQIAGLVAGGVPEGDAFATAAQTLGSPDQLKAEFRKIEIANRIPSLGWAAWILFVISFFLPACTDGFGWQCAVLSATSLTWPDFTFSWSNWATMLLFLMTPANAVMILSPFLAAKLTRRAAAFNWLRAANLVSFGLVWTYIILWITSWGAKELRVGCYLWGTSFLLFSLSLFRISTRKRAYA